jgi:hypothetical protein
MLPATCASPHRDASRFCCKHLQNRARCAPELTAAAGAAAQDGSMGRALYIESVEDAASMLGGYAHLAARLGVSTDDVASWSAGTAKPDCTVFLRLIEILLDPSSSRLA